MDALVTVVDSICEKLEYHQVYVNPYVKTDLLGVLSKYQIIAVREEPSNNMAVWIDNFVSAKKLDGLSASTLLSYDQRLGLFAKFIAKDVDNVITNDIRRYLTYLTEDRHIKETTLSTEINILRSFFAWLITEEIITKNPMGKIRSPKINKKMLRHPLNIEEIEHIRNGCKTDRDKALFEFFYSSGCRLSEVAGINIQDINLYERSVVVTGKGSKQRTVYFSTRAKIFLQEYLKNRKGEDSALFTSDRKPYGRLKTRAIQKCIQSMGKIANIESRTFPHILRHSFASHALNSGMDINSIQTLLGHEDINTTQIYASISIDTVRNEYRKVIF